MAKGQKRSNKEPRKSKAEKNAKQKDSGPKYLRAQELVQGPPGNRSKPGSKR